MTGWRDQYLVQLAFLLLAGGAALVFSACSAEAPAGNPPAGGASGLAPDFTLNRIGGGSVTLSQLRGKTVVIDFWATWCLPCEFQVPELNEFYAAHRSDGDLEVFGVSVDTEGVEIVTTWVAEKKVLYPVLLGDGTLARRFGVMGLPALVVIKPDGSVHSLHLGLIDSKTLEEILAEHQTHG